jgi:hypothetical protein
MAELRPAPRVAADKATAAGHKRVCVWERRPVARCALADQKGRRSLLCDRVREASPHGEAMAAQPTGTQHRGPTQEKGPKAQPRHPS